ncbi:MAG: hypothetical protein HY092_02055 [Candidatus Kerfeldbacteria bacterium]|nr:hypothetical protein [Candidatus Kerfeldbacteria bacterium]
MNSPEHVPLGDVIGRAGNMGGGKTNALVALATNPALRGGVLFLQHIDTCRSAPDRAESRTKARYEGAIAVDSVNTLRQEIERSAARNIFIDEVQFFCQDEASLKALCELVLQIRASGRNMFWSGLQMDFRGQPFEITAFMMSISTHLELLVPTCPIEDCGRPAPYPQRLEYGHPVPRSHPRYLPDTDATGRYTYGARCSRHFCLPEAWNEHSVAIHKALELSHKDGFKQGFADGQNNLHPELLEDARRKGCEEGKIEAHIRSHQID